MSRSLYIYAACALAITFSAAALRQRQKRRLPPGPPRKFIVGNLRDVPKAPEEWKGYAALGKRYGPVTYLRVLTQDIIILNTMKSARDLIERRIYSDRPQMTMVKDLVGFSWLLSLMPYGAAWRQHRRAIHQYLNERAEKRWWGVHEELNAQFLKHLMDFPDDWWELTHRLSAANVMRVTFGRNIPLKDDPWVLLSDIAVDVLATLASTGAYLVDLVPALKYLPDWFPGAQFKRDAKAWREIQLRSKEVPFRSIVNDMADGTAPPSIAKWLIESRLHDEEVVKNTVGVIYIGGVDTTVSALRGFVHAMVLNPQSQRAAQEEIARVIPASRLPTLEDRVNLPYVEALVRETMRQYPAVPLGVPHRVMDDDEYEGMHIPKGATVLVNIWAILQDETTYPSPELFQPERYLKNGELDMDVPDPRRAHFGFGRRMCPGRHLADAELWLLAATMLCCFHITPVVDEVGNDVLPSSVLSSGIIR
ncbi:cytochrome P450 [Exidia glandulosa HHB12029]|uniref:Cytochrome P450 n=1 Tax=Exidia glandulosa HHB12029 TaxID=1314781 RepID=A0A165Q3C6_EXIGL|nr:cytochrome P450 [Exidia glandulosa HHB12029]